MSNYYVIQVFIGQEEKIVELLKNNAYSNVVIDCFSVKKQRNKKYLGEWHVETENCFPGYIFVESDTPFDLFIRLKEINAFTKLLGVQSNDSYVIPISDSEKTFIDSLMNKRDDKGNKIISLSDAIITGDDKIKILSGPLSGQEGRIIKTDLHKRKVYIEITLPNMTIKTDLGINLVK